MLKLLKATNCRLIRLRAVSGVARGTLADLDFSLSAMMPISFRGTNDDFQGGWCNICCRTDVRCGSCVGDEAGVLESKNIDKADSMVMKMPDGENKTQILWLVSPRIRLQNGSQIKSRKHAAGNRLPAISSVTGMGLMVRYSSADFDQWAFAIDRHRRAPHGKTLMLKG
jgi:hypothetical protein